MKRFHLILIGLLLGFNCGASEVIRVACVGDSITFGFGVGDRTQNSYPKQLGKQLGAAYEVRNFGVNGATLLQQGDKPYRKESAYQQALKFNPNLVVIKLGTNDSKPQNWAHKAAYVADYIELIQSFRALPNKPAAWICTPVPAYPGNWGITDTVMKNEVIPLIDQVSKQSDTPIIDLYTSLSDQPQLFPDTVHPNAAGARVIADTIAKRITEPTQ